MSLRKRLIKLAHDKPELRPHLLPLLKQAARGDTADATIERLLKTRGWEKDRKAQKELGKLLMRTNYVDRPEQLKKFLPRLTTEQAKALRNVLGWPEVSPDFMVANMEPVEDAPWLYPEMDDWDGYKVSMTYETWDEESLEIGETDDKGWEFEDEIEDSLDDVGDRLSDHSWVEWSDSRGGGWLVSDGDEDYSTGERTYYNAFITRADGTELSRDEVQYLSGLVYL